MFGPGGNGDPFGNPFEHMHRHMRQMDNMMNAMIGDAFDMLNNFGMGMPRHPMLANDHHGRNGNGAITGRHNRPPPHPGHFDPEMNMMMNPFGGFGFGGNMLGGMMGQMQNIHRHAMNDPDSMMVSESTMISYNGNGQPKIVQSSTRKVGDVKENRKAVRDGEREEMSVEHNIGHRSHIIEKKRDKDGRIRQQQKFINLKEDEAREFNERFKSRAHQNMNGLFGGGGPHRHGNAIENGRTAAGRGGRGGASSSSGHYSGGEPSAPIITIPDDDEEEEPIRRGKYGRSGRASRYDDPDIVYSNNGTGPTIQEIDDNEMDSANPKRRKGVFGKFLG